MDKLRFAIFSIVVLSLLGLLGYWAVSTIQSGTEYQASQELEKLRAENKELETQVANLKKENETLLTQTGKNTTNSNAGPALLSDVPNPIPATTYKNQTLINDLQKLADSNILMKLKSSGIKVGTVQKFLNIYNNTSNKIDNDYGMVMEKAIMSFQKEQELTADGQIGKSTFLKMVDWLKK